jgi:hypothetical protein
VYAKEIYSLIKMSFDQIEEIRERKHLLSIDDRFLLPRQWISALRTLNRDQKENSSRQEFVRVDH